MRNGMNEIKKFKNGFWIHDKKIYLYMFSTMAIAVAIGSGGDNGGSGVTSGVSSSVEAAAS